MKSLFNAADNRDILARISRLSPDTRPLWGKMNVTQMVAHCQVPMQVALGERKLKRGLIGLLFGGMAKRRMVGEIPFRRNLPTDPNYIIPDDGRDFALEQERLMELVERFAKSGPAGLTKEAHPFFGKMTVEEWDILSWKHLDHHLRQFGV